MQTFFDADERQNSSKLLDSAENGALSKHSKGVSGQNTSTIDDLDVQMEKETPDLSGDPNVQNIDVIDGAGSGSGIRTKGSKDDDASSRNVNRIVSEIADMENKITSVEEEKNK